MDADDATMVEHITPVSTKSKPRKRKSRFIHHDDDGYAVARDNQAKRTLYSLTKPSCVLALRPNHLRTEHRVRLHFLLRRLVKRHQWVAACDVLKAYMKGTVNDRSPLRNRFKYSVLLQLLKHVEKKDVNSTRIQNIYDIWSKKIGSMKIWPVESRYAVNLENMLFCLMEGHTNDAHQLAVCLEQENVDIDPVSKMIMGLTFYELWREKQSDLQENSHMEGTSFSNEVGQSDCHNTVKSRLAESQDQCDSEASVMNGKQISKGVGFNEVTRVSMEVDVNHEREKPLHTFQRGLYLDSEEHNRIEDPFSNYGGLTQDTLYALGRLDLWLLPLRFPDENSLVKHRTNPHEYYISALKYLELALSSSTPALAALLPLTQLLLIEGQADDALDLLENQCRNSASVLPIRLRAALVENFDRNNSLLLVSCFEDILKKDPTCSDSLSKLIKMHQNGEYSLHSLLEMIASHLDATYAEYNTWKVFCFCFFKLSLCEEECISACSIKNGGNKQHQISSKTPIIFTQGKSGKSWRLRCRWWLTRHFSNSKLDSDIQKGDLQLLTYKAACASYMYGHAFNYVVKAYSHIEKENDKDLLLFLDEHRRNSFGFYQQKKATCMT
ncbi:PREDICTED: uncharacterized protein LOC109348123 [Lupinus angustifolius]|uniref:uncharacterized protein LOC109348123 n=1 Tax=Lupinus angustifolius TaxID=3871 RepID=UPI00092E90E3|nr:PREDICTED: uncharacterized protein LOC109348123 [Lupinus angustifolius]